MPLAQFAESVRPSKPKKVPVKLVEADLLNNVPKLLVYIDISL